jgi:hypothetical protein
MPNSAHGVPPGTRVMTPQKAFKKLLNLIQIGSLWAWKNVRGYGRKVHAKFWPWGMPWDQIYDHLGPILFAKVSILIDEILLTWPYGHLQNCFLVFYYWIGYEKSESGYTSSGGWTFCKFVDFRLFFRFWVFESRTNALPNAHTCTLMRTNTH